MGKSSNGPQETAADRAVAEVAKARVDDFRKRWRPQQTKVAGQIDAMGAEDSRERRSLRGAVATDSDVAFGRANEKALDASFQTNSFGSAGQKLGVGSMGDAQATSVGLGINQADLGVDQAHKAGLAGIVSRGQGREARADSGLIAQAQMARQVADADAQAALEKDMGVAALAGRAAGIGLGQFGSTPTRDINREQMDEIAFANSRERAYP